jgi:hypothetical protein
MSCCGNKRQSLNFFPAVNQASLQPESIIEIDFTGSNKEGETLFLFTGKTLLEVTSLFGSQKYVFTEANPIVSVLPEDSALMRAYSDLVEIKS